MTKIGILAPSSFELPVLKEYKIQRLTDLNIENELENPTCKIYIIDKNILKIDVQDVLGLLNSTPTPYLIFLYLSNDQIPAPFRPHLVSQHLICIEQDSKNAWQKIFINALIQLDGITRASEEMLNKYRYINTDQITNLEQKVFDFFTLSQMGKSLLAIQNIDELAHIFLSSVYESSNASNCVLLLRDESDDTFRCVKCIGIDPEVIKDIKFKKEEGLFWQILNSGDPFPIIDIEDHYRFASIIKKWNLNLLESQIWIPIKVKDKLLGVVTLGKKKDGAAYREMELSFILQLGNQAAIAFESAILDEQKERAGKELKKKMDTLSIVYSVSKALNFANDLNKILLFILDKARDAVDAEKGSIMLLDMSSNKLIVHVVRGVPPDVEERINKGAMECKEVTVGEGVAGTVARTLKPIFINDTKHDNRFKDAQNSFTNSIICMPLVVNEKCIGVLNLTNKKGGNLFLEEDLDIVQTLANQAAITIHNARLYHLAITDGLTQLKIHRYFQQRLTEELERSLEFKHPTSLIMSDIDHFKSFNDTYGHQQGDIVLIETARLFRLCVRDFDVAARYGGEEFAIILPESDKKAAMQLAEKIRQTIEAYEYPAKGGKKLKVTISFGVATYPNDADSQEALIKTADTALYKAKESGRNRVCCSE